MDFDQVMDQLSKAVAHLAEMLQPWREQIATCAQFFMDAVRETYRADGAVYGDTDDGMMRWVREQAEIARLRREAEYLVQRQAFVRDWRAQLARKETDNDPTVD